MTCQLCESNVPKFPSDRANFHIVSWEGGWAGSIPCTQVDRQKMQADNELLERLAKEEKA